VVFCYCQVGFSQITSDKTLSFGGIKLKPDQQQTIDDALFGAYYQFRQKASEGDKTIIVTDTLFLAIGSSHSLFLDPYYKEKLETSRLARIARSRKIGRVNMEHNNVNDIAHLIGVNSDYKEENNGDPVQIYKNRNAGTVSSVYNAFADNLICEQQIKEFRDWAVTDETDTIFDYPCRKAKVSYAGRNYSAWFTPDIPVSDGPWKFHGLPGLILKVEDDEKLFQYTAIGLQQYYEKTDIVKDNVKYENCSLKEFNGFVRKEKSRNAISFHNGGQLYMTYKQSPITYIEMEIEE
jgi:GLPGLI family protein